MLGSIKHSSSDSIITNDGTTMGLNMPFTVENKLEMMSSHSKHLKLLEITFLPTQIVQSIIIPLFKHAISNTNDSNTNDETTAIIDMASTDLNELISTLSHYPVHVLQSISETKDKRGHTPLHEACYKGDYERVKWLLNSCKARPSIRDARGATALFYASQFGHAQCCKHLLQSGANAILEKNHRMEGPIFIASLKGHHDALQELLHSLDNTSLSDNTNNQQLLPPPPPLNTYIDKAKGKDKLNACAVEWTPSTPYQSQQQSDTNQTKNNIVAESAGEDLASLTCDGDQFSPLHSAVLRGCVSTLKLLLKYNFNINAQNKYEQTALHLAARHPERGELYCELSKLLISHGIRINLKDDNGKTALDYCQEYRKSLPLSSSTIITAPTLAAEQSGESIASLEHDNIGKCYLVENIIVANGGKLGGGPMRWNRKNRPKSKNTKHSKKNSKKY
jgi:ankyrin repeat protein